MDERYVLKDGDHIGVVGGGPTGTFFSIFAQKMAEMVDKKLNITIYEPKDFTKEGPGGCNKCGGIISELLVQTLAVEGINLPDSVVQKGINSYKLHTVRGNATIETPALEKTIASVYRGGGPKGLIEGPQESFDQYLLSLATKAGAVHKRVKVDQIEYRGEKPVLFSKGEKLQEADLVVGAFGVNAKTPSIFEEIGFGYKTPPTIKTAIAEIGMDRKVIAEHFGNSIFLFLLPAKNLKFAALIPKTTHLTVCIIGKHFDKDTINDFLDLPVVKSAFPDEPFEIQCRCVPKMNTSAPKRPFTDRLVICGDAGSTRLMKDGIGAAYFMSKAAAKTAVFHGVSSRHFQKDYYPVYKSLIFDNWCGRYLFFITDLYKKYPLLTKGMIEVVRAEQQDPDNPKILSSILWDMFTGNERYKQIVARALSLKMHIDLWREFAKDLLKFKVGDKHERPETWKALF